MTWSSGLFWNFRGLGKNTFAPLIICTSVGQVLQTSVLILIRRGKLCPVCQVDIWQLSSWWHIKVLPFSHLRLTSNHSVQGCLRNPELRVWQVAEPPGLCVTNFMGSSLVNLLEQCFQLASWKLFPTSPNKNPPQQWGFLCNTKALKCGLHHKSPAFATVLSGECSES